MGQHLLFYLQTTNQIVSHNNMQMQILLKQLCYLQQPGNFFNRVECVAQLEMNFMVGRKRTLSKKVGTIIQSVLSTV